MLPILLPIGMVALQQPAPIDFGGFEALLGGLDPGIICHHLLNLRNGFERDDKAQDSSAAKKHDAERMRARNETCIDCHKGIGHDLPPGYE